MRLLEYNIGEGVRAFSTKRDGGIGSGTYAGFNITHYCGDDEQAVAHARALLCQELNIDISRLFLPRQTHGSEVLRIDNDFLSSDIELQNELLYGKDAVITDVPGLCIGVSTADCVPILLYDSLKRAVAAVHAGWRGTLSRIVEKCLETMIECYGSSPSDIKAIIGPSISLQAFEVGEEVYDAFAKDTFPMQQIACRMDDKWHIDLWEANRLQLLGCGIADNSVVICGICTYTQYAEFFSARRLGIESGRIFNGIILE